MTRVKVMGWRLLPAVIALVAVGCSPVATQTPTTTRQAATPATTHGVLDPISGLPFVDAADLPPQATTTLGLIASGGPFPYSQDGVIFDNREGLLPSQPSGYYHEYTVATPGSHDRGARRIVSGKGGELYYTDDHYDSFARIRQ
jgi:ribonuclease T1